MADFITDILAKNNIFAPTNPIGGPTAGPTTTNKTSPTSVPPVSGVAQGLGDLSSILGGFSSGKKADRALEGQFTQNYDQLMLQAQQDRRVQEADALRKLNQTAYIGQGGSHFDPGTLSLNGQTHQLTDHGLGPIAPSAAEQTGAKTLEGQMLTRLQPGGSYTPQPLAGYAKPGKAENIASYGGSILGGLGALKTIAGGGSGGEAGTAAAGAGAGGVMSGMLGKAVPLVGAATGIAGVLQNKSPLSAIGSGAGAGASIGSMVAPGIGTAIGAGIGALGGGLRSLWGHFHKPKAPVIPQPLPPSGRTMQDMLDSKQGQEGY